MQSIQEVYDPIRDATIHVVDWERGYTRSDERAELEAIARRQKLGADVIEVMPQNVASRFVAASTGIIGSRGGEVVIVGRSVSRLAKLVRDRCDDRPLSAGELDQLLRGHQEQANAAKRFFVVVLSSPTGWSVEACQVVHASQRQQSFYHRFLSVCLLDIATEEFIANEHDDRIRGLLPSLGFELETERVDRCVTHLRKILAGQRSVTLAKVTSMTGCDEETTKKAFARLCKQGQFSIDTIDSEWVIFPAR